MRPTPVVTIGRAGVRPVARVLGLVATLVVLLGAAACRGDGVLSSGQGMVRPEVALRGRYELQSVAAEPVPTASAPDGVYRVRSGELILGPGDQAVRRVWYEPMDPTLGNPMLLRVHEGTFSLEPGGAVRLALVDPVAASLVVWRPEAVLEEHPSDGSVRILLQTGTMQDGRSVVERYVRERRRR